MSTFEEPPHHHLPKLADDEDNDNNNDNDDETRTRHPYPFHHDPGAFDTNPRHTPPPRHHTPRHTPPPRHHTPRHTPPPPHHHPKHGGATPSPVVKTRVLPPATPSPPPPPQKLRPPPEAFDDDDDDDGRYNPNRQVAAVIAILLFLFGLAALILWLVYRPQKPKFTAIAAAVYALNATATAPPFISAAVQITVMTRNPNKRTAVSYDGLTATVFYRNHPITPPASLPPLHHLRESTVMMSPVVNGGGVPVAVTGDVVAGLGADEAYGVVGLSWVLTGRRRYNTGWFKSGHRRVVVRCDVLLGAGGGGGGGSVFRNPGGQVPLLGTPPCLVDM